MLTDMSGNPFVFFRGGVARSDGFFVTNCFDLACSYAGSDSCNKMHISVDNMIIITEPDDELYSHYEYIDINRCYVYPSGIKPILLNYSRELGRVNELSTDEIVRCVRGLLDTYDAILFRNIKESGFSIPVCDLFCFDLKCASEIERINSDDKDVSLLREYTNKCVDMYPHVELKGIDGLTKIISKDTYQIECKNLYRSGAWINIEEIVVASTRPISIVDCETTQKLKGEECGSGKYYNTYGVSGTDVFIPNEGKVRIIEPEFLSSYVRHDKKKYKIEYVQNG